MFKIKRRLGRIELKISTIFAIPMSDSQIIDLSEIDESGEGKDLYPFQEAAIQQISNKLNELEDGHNVLFQLPTVFLLLAKD